MDDCSKIEQMIRFVVGDEVVGFIERKLITSTQEVRVFTPVYAAKTKPQGFVN